VLVLHKGSIAALGKPQHIYTTELIREVYGAEASIMNHPLTGAPQILLAPNVRINNGELE
jgi:iron complex transport system ATP-binding protein